MHKKGRNMMKAYLTNLIEETYDKEGLEAAQAIYRAAFINTRAYARHMATGYSNLTLDGYANCIVTE